MSSVSQMALLHVSIFFPPRTNKVKTPREKGEEAT
jgi:hypothetical protein